MEPVIKINSGASKWDIRQQVWDYIEENNLANFPRPVHNRIPNFKAANQACNRLADLQVFKSSQTVKINPDKPQQQARFVTLEAQKTLLVPTPRLRTGLFNKITPPQGASKEQLRVCSSSQGVKDFSVPVDLNAKVKVDLLVIGSVAVSEKGFRIGKGEGYADLEHGMMVSMGAVNESTVVVTVVHDCQIVDIPEELIGSHDLTVDYILTPTRVIKTNCPLPKPQGIIWTKLEKIPILKTLRDLEEQAGKDVTLGGEDERGKGKSGRNMREKGPEEGGSEVPSQRKLPLSVTTVYLGGIPAGLRVSELKTALREREVAPLRLTWQGAQHRAFLDYSDPQAADQALESLQGLSLNGHSLQAELARSQPGGKRSGQPSRRSRPSTAIKSKTAPPGTKDDTTENTEQ
uniref:Methenyltetrahydrofolate synthase domain-containing protein n=1 Tax=Monopterus albus TaxID=43700 RepID=A0A3Q3Q246_MONAL